MAEAGVPSSFLKRFGEDHLQCSICQDLYSEPKTLQCFHTFCKECLSTYCNSQWTPRKIRCPICRRETPANGGIRNITTDFRLAGMIQAITDTSRLSTVIPRCSRHAGKKYSVFCETCHQLICLSCLTESHIDCEVMEVGEINIAEKRKSVRENMQIFEKSLKENYEAEKVYLRLKRDLEGVEETMKKVEDKASQVVARVIEEENRILDELSNMQSLKQRQIARYSKDLKSQKETLQDLVDDSKIAIKTYDDYEFLQKYPNLSTGLQAACKVPEIDMPKLKFIPSSVISLVGQVSGSSTQELPMEVDDDCDEDYTFPFDDCDLIN